jgi:capsular polysaccharide biosynthesis protein
MDSSTPFNLMIFTDSTKKVCMCSASSIFIIVLFIISPLSNFFLTSILMKAIALILLVYTIYLNNEQTNLLRLATNSSQPEQVKSQLNMNILCSYVFTIFIGLLIIFVIKSFL